MFHSSNPSLFGRPAGVLSEVQALRGTLSELRTVCISLSEKQPDAVQAATRMLSSLAEHLSIAFDSGSHTAYFKVMTDECPSLAEPITKLARSRARLRDSVAWVQGLADHVTQSNTPLLGRHIVHILDALVGHEQAENELLQQFFLRAGEGTRAATEIEA
jgi:hypothetical protein